MEENTTPQLTDNQTILIVAELASRMRSLLVMTASPFPAGSLADSILRDAAAAAPHITRAIEIAKANADKEKEQPAP